MIWKVVVKSNILSLNNYWYWKQPSNQKQCQKWNSRNNQDFSFKYLVNNKICNISPYFILTGCIHYGTPTWVTFKLFYTLTWERVAMVYLTIQHFSKQDLPHVKWQDWFHNNWWHHTKIPLFRRHLRSGSDPEIGKVQRVTLSLENKRSMLLWKTNDRTSTKQCPDETYMSITFPGHTKCLSWYFTFQWNGLFKCIHFPIYRSWRKVRLTNWSKNQPSVRNRGLLQKQIRNKAQHCQHSFITIWLFPYIN